VNAHGLAVLELAEALALVAGHASSELGAAAVRALEPTDARGWIEPELRRVDQMAAFLLRAEEWSPPPVPDVRQPLRRLALEGAVLDGAALRDVGVLLASGRQAREALSRQARDYPLLVEVAERLVAREPEEQDVRRTVDDGGLVRDGASRELARLRRDLRGARARIVERLEQYMASLPERVRVADASVTVREGRFVIPIRREGRGEVGGLVHDESATGVTLFVEPPVAIELMNRLRELELAEAREVQRILRELSDRLRPHAAELMGSLEALVALDSLYARGRYALHFDGRRPELAPPGARAYVVVNGRHPLLLAGAEPIVPFDLALEPDEGTLLVSGPNTGGKTVLLKAMGLISALVQAGVVPPVGQGTTLPIFRDIFADIGDEQSIEASLSTFSAHLRNLREILEQADDACLALIDEIGSGTDPAEGGALAAAILKELTRRGTRTVATTHLGQLKALAAEEPGIVNASLQFDALELRPTYRLLKGVPGRSYGLAIARRLGFPEWLLAAAEAHLPEEERSAARLLLELEEKERAMAAALAEAESQRQAAVELRRSVEEREHEIRKREREAERRARQQARDLLLGAREEVEAAIRQLREEAGTAELDAAARGARARVERAARRQVEKQPEAAPAGGGGAAAELAAGSRVRVAATGATGILVEVRDGRGMVETGGVRMQVPLSGLAPAVEEQPRPAVRGGWQAAATSASPEIDLRGLRAEEIAGKLQPAVDAAVQADLRWLRIIHGKGTGALREVVQELLETDPRVRSFRGGGPGEGGSGVTMAELA
jgi:DNA mismatch repair protein MutS2